MNVKIGSLIRIIEMQGESKYSNKIGVVTSIDSMGQLHGTWGGCAINNSDSIEILSTDNDLEFFTALTKRSKISSNNSKHIVSN